MFGDIAPTVRFANRREAGRILADRLGAYAARSDVVVLGLPRGGMPVAREVATALGAPLDVFVVRKLGVPFQPELAMGAIASGGIRVLNDDVIRLCRIPDHIIEHVVRVEQQELERRERAYRDGRPALAIAGRVAILVDDGLATGSTMRAAVAAVRRLRPSEVVVAVPVGARDTCEEMSAMADQVVCAEMPEAFGSVGACYEDFSQITDDEVKAALQPARSACHFWRRS
jgi:predicted phosphoribosyltransferase